VIGLATLTTKGASLASPKLNRRRALLVLAKIDEILSWEKGFDRERDARFVELGRFLCEARSGQYWRADNLKSFDEFLEKRFPHSRRKAYYLMAIHEHLRRIPKSDLQKLGWTKAKELAKMARREGQDFESAIWLQKADVMHAEEFKHEVKRQLTGRETERREPIYFTMSKNQLAVVEQALAIAASILGHGNSRAYALEMICADFVAGASREPGAENMLLLALTRLVAVLPMAQRLELLEVIKKNVESVKPEAPKS
jgi:hypothetical protein